VNKAAALSEICRTSAIGIAFTILLVFAQMAFEHTFLGHQVELLTYNLLQHRLQLPASAELDVVVIDISGIEKELTADGKDMAVSRPELQEILAAVVGHGPKAIGVDVDFSTINGRYATQFDRAFLEYCRSTDPPVRIRLGVYPTAGETPDQVLGSPDYRMLAGAMATPASSLDPFTMRMPVRIGVPLTGSTISSLASAVVDRDVPAMGGLQSLFLAAVEEREAKADTEAVLGGVKSGTTLVTSEEFLVNYASLAALEKQTIEAATRSDIENLEVGKRVRGKYVFIGIADPARTNGRDVFVLPEVGFKSGVYVHASAAYTLLSAPLLVLKKWARIAIDFVAAGLVFAIVGWIDYRYRGDRRVATHRLHGVFNVAVIVAVLFVGGWLVPYTRVFWPDFLLLCVTAAVHGPVERTTLSITRWIRPRIRSATKAVVFEADEEAHH
jgi:CHASE2 domain-containing sensor protein